MSADTVSITFPDLSPAEASILAQELVAALADDGVPASNITRKRASADAQDMGAVIMVAAGAYLLELALEAGKEFAKGAANRAGKRAIDAILRKWGTRAKIDCPGRPSEMIGTEYRRSAAPRSRAQAETLAELRSLGVVLLGASSFPSYPPDKQLDNPAFKRSAEIARELFSPSYTVFRESYVLDLFDQDLRPDEIVDRIEDHVTKHSDMRDVIVYYCGHGDFLSDRERTYYLALRSTRPGREAATGLGLKSFRHMIEQAQLLQKRCTFILDCCFAGAAVDAFQFSGPDSLVAQQLQDLPSKGFALMTAADRKLPAYGRDGAGATMFTGALAAVLRAPPQHAGGEQLSLSDLCAQAAAFIKSKHGLEGVLPQCHAPVQTDGDVSRVPMFVIGAPPPSSIFRSPSPVNSKRLETTLATQPASANQDTVELVIKGQPVRVVPGNHQVVRLHDVAPAMVAVPSGKFIMGSEGSKLRQYCEVHELDAIEDETPPRVVTIERPLLVGVTPVTLAQFKSFADRTDFEVDPGAFGFTPDGKRWDYKNRWWGNPGFPQDDDHPVTCVSWDDAQEYLEWLQVMTGDRYRLLTEAEWEYCCRAGSTSWYSWGNQADSTMANVNDGNGRQGTVAVRRYQPNAWGLYQMHGNVQEWCDDPWHNNYQGAPSDGRRWPGGDTSRRVVRGGSWWHDETSARSAFRDSMGKDLRSIMAGFRVALDR